MPCFGSVRWDTGKGLRAPGILLKMGAKPIFEPGLRGDRQMASQPGFSFFSSSSASFAKSRRSAAEVIPAFSSYTLASSSRSRSARLNLDFRRLAVRDHAEFCSGVWKVVVEGGAPVRAVPHAPLEEQAVSALLLQHQLATVVVLTFRAEKR